MKRLLSLTVSLAISVCFAPVASACAACFGKSDSALAYGMNAGILALLAVIGTMLACVASFFVFIVRRASRIESATGSPETTSQS